MKKKKGFVLAYASVLMAVVMILIASITSLIQVMSSNNNKVSDLFYESTAVSQTLEYFLAGSAYNDVLTTYASEQDLTAEITESATQRELSVHKENGKLLLKVIIKKVDGKEEIVYMSYGE